MTFNANRVICSTITLRHLPLPEALEHIAALGFRSIDLGALPGVCNHVPFVLDSAAVDLVTEQVRASGLSVRSINADIGDLNAPLDADAQAARDRHLTHLLDLAVAIGSAAIVLPNGAQSAEAIESLDADFDRVAAQLARAADAADARGIEIWVEAPHFHRLVGTLERTADFLPRVDPRVGVVLDVSHIVASGGSPRDFVAQHAARTRHVHLRDAEPGYINHSIGRGQVDFADALAALQEVGYNGAFSLELETRDTENADRPRVAGEAAAFISALLPAA